MATRQPKELTSEQLAERVKSAGIQLFQQRRGFPLSSAQTNLKGRTHYVDDTTISFFDSKILACEVLDDGLVLGIVESIKPTPDEGRIYRPVFFDLFGNVIACPEIEDSFKNQKQAQAAFWAMSEEFDPVEATMKGIREKQKVLQTEIDKLDDLTKELKG